MPLIEQTVVKDGDEVVETKVRRLYSLPELKALDEEGSEEIESRAYENALDKMRERAYQDDWYLEETLDNDGRELLKAIGIEIPPKTEEIHVKVNGKFQYDENNKPVKKWITREDSIWDGYSADEHWFSLSKRARVDEKVFLTALKWYLAGKDIRTLPALRWGMPEGSSAWKRGLAASERQQRKLDRRSKDARIIREQGLTFASAGWGSRSSIREFDFDYHYMDLSEQFATDANELLTDVLDEVGFLLRDEEEYRTSDEALIEDAEANEHRFDKDGHLA